MAGTTDLLEHMLLALADPAPAARVAAEFGPTTVENACAVVPFQQVIRLDVTADARGFASSIILWLTAGGELALTDLIARHGPAVRAGTTGSSKIVALHWSGPVRLYATLTENGSSSREFVAERIG